MLLLDNHEVTAYIPRRSKMNQQIVQIDNIFDLFALLSSYILDHIQEDSYILEDFSDDDYIEVHDAVEKYIYWWSKKLTAQYNRMRTTA